MVDGFVIKVFGGDGFFDDFFEDFFVEFFGGDVFVVLSRDDDSVDVERDDGIVVVFVFNGNLGFGVGMELGERVIVVGGRYGSVKLVGEEESEGEEFGGFVGGIIEYDILIISIEVFEVVI